MTVATRLGERLKRPWPRGNHLQGGKSPTLWPPAPPCPGLQWKPHRGHPRPPLSHVRRRSSSLCTALSDDATRASQPSPHIVGWVDLTLPSGDAVSVSNNLRQVMRRTSPTCNVRRWVQRPRSHERHLELHERPLPRVCSSRPCRMPSCRAVVLGGETNGPLRGAYTGPVRPKTTAYAASSARYSPALPLPSRAVAVRGFITFGTVSVGQLARHNASNRGQKVDISETYRSVTAVSRPYLVARTSRDLVNCSPAQCGHKCSAYLLPGRSS